MDELSEPGIYPVARAASLGQHLQPYAQVGRRQTAKDEDWHEKTHPLKMSSASAARVISRRDFLSGSYVELLEAPFLLIEDSLACSAYPLVSNLVRTARTQQ